MRSGCPVFSKMVCKHIPPARQVDHHLIPLAPVARYLQHRRPRQSAMREQHPFLEGRLPNAHPRLNRNARQLRNRRQPRLFESERHKGRARLHDPRAMSPQAGQGIEAVLRRQAPALALTLDPLDLRVELHQDAGHLATADLDVVRPFQPRLDSAARQRVHGLGPCGRIFNADIKAGHIVGVAQHRQRQTHQYLAPRYRSR